MRAIANFAMQGKMQAVGLSSAFAFLSLLFLPLGVISAGIISLVTLKIGLTAGFSILAWTLLATFVAQWLVPSQEVALMASVIGLYLPAWLLSAVLREKQSFDLMVLVAVAVACAAVVGFHAIQGDVQTFWMQWIDAQVKPSLSAAALSVPEDVWPMIAQSMTGLLASVALAFALTGVILGRYWQAMLFNPNGFQREFHALQLGKGLAIFNVLILVMAFMQDWPASSIAVDLLTVMTLAFTLQGLAVTHYFVAQKKASVAWFYGVYPLIILIPQAMMMVASVGFMDAWFRLRERLTPPSGPNLNKD